MTPSNAKDDAVEAVALRERASKAVEMLMRLEDTPYFSGGRGPSPVHELRAVIEAQSAAIEAMRAAQPVEDDAVETVTDKMIGAGWVVMSKAFGRDVPDRTIRAFYLAMRAAHVTAQEGKEDK
jgi:hypothetical protein